MIKMDEKNLKKCKEYILSKIKVKPRIALVLGSGLGDSIDSIENAVVIKYSELAGFPETTVEGHQGVMVICDYAGKNVVLMKGRYHYYEGYSIEQVTYYVRVLKEIGISEIIFTNAAGGINSCFSKGDLMLITDHISLFLPESPLRRVPGYNLQGDMFMGMTEIYTKSLQRIAETTAQACDIQLRKGVYVYLRGPMYETPAEIKLLGYLGADAVGMSTVPEVIVAKQLGIKIVCISCITNMAGGFAGRDVSHKEVIETAADIRGKFKMFIEKLIENI
jgi:purine-nucleoside phosphorylase